MKQSFKISESEWEIMTVLWKDPPLPVTEIVERIGSRKEWASRTIRTLVDRLAKKGVLRIQQDGKRYLYWPQVSMSDCVKQESESFVKKFFGGERASMLLHLVKETDLSPEQVRALKKLLSEKEK
jgi:BlaI family penicillinase repressor